MEENKETVVAVIQNNGTEGENYVSVGVGYKEEVQQFKITDDELMLKLQTRKQN